MSPSRKILIISPHFPPSNLAAVHRSRLFAQHLPSFGWEPIILTVHEKFYEEKLDLNLTKLVPPELTIEKVNAFGITKPRIVGDIGIRGLWQLYRKAKKLIKEKKIDFLYIPIPSFYAALLGRWLNSSTGIKYGIDYIDPWVHKFPGSDKRFSRHWWSTKLSSVLEPYAIKNASLITGVAEGYYKEVFERNPEFRTQMLTGAMPYGGEPADHIKVRILGLKPYLFEIKSSKIQLVYAGALLPKAYDPLRLIFRAIKEHPEYFRDLELHFIGTGRLANDANSHTVKPIALEYGLWETVVFEYAKRIPYLDVLCHLEAAKGVFVLGSTEPHYTPSKVYQGILSGKPVFAVLHYASTAAKVIASTNSGVCCTINPENLEQLPSDFIESVERYKDFASQFKPEMINLDGFDQYSARVVTKNLAALLDKVVEAQNNFK